MNVANFVQVLATFSWVLVVGAIGFGAFLITRQQKVGQAITIIVAAILLSGTLTVVSAGLVFVEPQNRAVVISALQPAGIRTEALTPGLHWIIPFFENTVIYPISRQTYTMSSAGTEGSLVGDDTIPARTADGQVVFIDASVIFQVDESNIIQLHIDWQNRYIFDFVRPQVRGIVRNVVSRYGIEEIVTSRRDEMSLALEDQLIERFGANGLIMLDFVLRNITFTEEYAASIEQKQIAEQDAQRAAFVVQQRQQEAEQVRVTAQGAADASVIRAQGEAQARILEAEAESAALRLISEALSTNPDLLEYTYVQNLADNITVMLVPANSPYLFSLPDPNTGSISTGVPSFVVPTPDQDE